MRLGQWGKAVLGCGHELCLAHFWQEHSAARLHSPYRLVCVVWVQQFICEESPGFTALLPLPVSPPM